MFDEAYGGNTTGTIENHDEIFWTRNERVIYGVLQVAVKKV